MVKPNHVLPITKGITTLRMTGGGGESIPSPNGGENTSPSPPTFSWMKGGRRDGEGCSMASSSSEAALFPSLLAGSAEEGVAPQGITQLCLFAAGTGERQQWGFLAIDPHFRPSKQRKCGVVQKHNRKYFLFLCFGEQMSSGVVCCWQSP